MTSFTGNEQPRCRSHGFTLLELLIVIAIVGILAAMGVPQYLQYRARANNASALGDIQTIRTAEHALFLDKQQFGSTAGTGCSGDPICAGAINFGVAGVTDVVLRPGTTLEAIGTLTSFTAVTKAVRGDRVYCVDSDVSSIRYASAATNTTIGAPFRAPVSNTGVDDCLATFPNVQ